MTMNATPRTVNAVGNGVTTSFSFGTARIFDAADLVVTVDGVVKTLGADYTVVSGSVIFGTAPADGAAVQIVSRMAQTRGTDFGAAGRVTPLTLDADLDRLTALVQEQGETIEIVATEAGAAAASPFATAAAASAADALASKNAADLDAVATAADRVQTGLDAVATAADRVQTGLDAVATAADRVQTGLDAVATAADRVQTGLDAVATDAARTAVAADRAYIEGNENSIVQRIEAIESFDLGDKLHPSAPPGFAWSVTDEAGKAAIGLKHDGTFAVAEFEDFNAAGASMLDGLGHVGFAYVIEDGAGKAALGIRDNGEVVARALAATDLTVEKINGRDFVSVSSAGGRYTHQLNFINNTGQSLGEGSDGTITTVQEYDNVGFPARAVSPAAYLPLTVANTQWSTRGESPIYGTLGHIKELIAEENGLAYADNDYQLLVCNNAVSGRSITELEKGTTYYNNAISQVQAGYDIAQGTGRTFAFQAVTYTQGEADVAMDAATYRDKLITLAADFNTDGKAITGQYNDVIMIMYQCASQVRSLAITHLEAANLSPRIFMACPMYQFSYYDYQHIDALSSKWLGGYYGLVYKRVVIDGLDWEPLQPIAHAVTGSTIDLYFNKTGLTLDTVAIPAQTNYGFDVVDELGAAVTVSSVVILAPNRVRITCAAPPEVGWAVRYGYGNAVGKSPFVGGCGNLRDRQGDKIVYAAIDKPMHNWCVIFNYSL